MNEAMESGICGLHLNAREREQISNGLAQGLSFRAISKQLKRPASTISREKLRHQVPADKEGAAAISGILGAATSRHRQASLRAQTKTGFSRIGRHVRVKRPCSDTVTDGVVT